MVKSVMEKAIEATMLRMRDSAFVWGENDCDTIMADYVMMLGYIDPMAEWRGKYNSAEGATALIGQGFNSDLVAKGMASVGILPKTTAVRGDVVSSDIQGVHVTGLCIGPRCVFKRQGSGMIQLRFAKIVKAWSCV